MTRRATATIGFAAVLAASACAGEPPPVTPRTPHAVEVTMREYRFEVDRELPAGRLIFTARNAGRLDHQLVLVPLPADFNLSLEAQLRSPTRRALPPLAFLPARGPGRTGKFAVDAAPGRYGLVCLLKSAGDSEAHALKGMAVELRVRPRPRR